MPNDSTIAQCQVCKGDINVGEEHKCKHAGGRPSEYKPEYCESVDKYLEENQDEEVEVVKQRNDEKARRARSKI